MSQPDTETKPDLEKPNPVWEYKYIDNNELEIKWLSYDNRNKQLVEKKLSKYGRVVSTDIDDHGIAYVVMDSNDSANAAAKALDRKMFSDFHDTTNVTVRQPKEVRDAEEALLWKNANKGDGMAGGTGVFGF